MLEITSKRSRVVTRPDGTRVMAVISPCANYRYVLFHEWDNELSDLVVIGLNPSTADAHVDDPTLRRCVDFAKRWGYGGLTMLNLFAFRSTDPKALREVEDPIGPDNDFWLGEASDTREGGLLSPDGVLAAWGAHAPHERAYRVATTVGLNRLWCLGITQAGAPRHPLYIPATTPAQRFAIGAPVA